VQWLLDAFRRAHKAAKIMTYDEAFGELNKLSTQQLAGHILPFDEAIVAQALILLRARGVPEPLKQPDPLFERMVQILKTCKEVPHDSDPAAGRTPAA